MSVFLGAIKSKERIFIDWSRGYRIDKYGKDFIIEDLDGKKRIYKTKFSAMNFVKRQKKM